MFTVMLLLAGCATHPAARSATAWEQTGKATFYGREQHGTITASGERFDMNALTAAHRTLPFGTRVRVENLLNGKTVEVRITDRGPYGRGRVIDVSYKAARVLDMIDRGVVPVRITLR